VRGALAAKPTKAEQARTTGPRSTSCAASIARCKLMKCTFRRKSLPDLFTMKSSRTSSSGDLGAASSMRGPLRRDSQAGAAKRRDRHDMESIDEKKFVTILPSHRGGVKPLGARSLSRREATPPDWAAQTESEKVRRRETRSHRERTRHGCSRLKQQMAETDRTHQACGARSRRKTMRVIYKLASGLPRKTALTRPAENPR